MHCLKKAFQNQHAKSLCFPALSLKLHPGLKPIGGPLVFQKARQKTEKQREDGFEANGSASVAPFRLRERTETWKKGGRPRQASLLEASGIPVSASVCASQEADPGARCLQNRLCPLGALPDGDGFPYQEASPSIPLFSRARFSQSPPGESAGWFLPGTQRERVPACGPAHRVAGTPRRLPSWPWPETSRSQLPP